MDKNGIFSKRLYKFHATQSIHQGDVLSPLLANIYLDKMDKFLENKNIFFIRYADDFAILAKNKPKAKEILENLKEFLKT